jgi:tetratricopeptide (TPR) repeat protein
MAKQTRQRAAPPRAHRTAAATRSPAARGGGGHAKPAARSQGPNRPPPGQPAPRQTESVAPAPPRKPGYHEALAMYERGVRGLQRHDYEGAAVQFRTIIDRYPEERELQERSRLYLRVCERETARRPPTPQTPQERVYAATVALNAGDPATALEHLRRALGDAPDNDHAQYIMSVALASTGAPADAVEHLRQAISLNPENRALARQDPDLEPLRALDGFADLVDGPAAALKNRQRKRR